VPKKLRKDYFVSAEGPGGAAGARKEIALLLN